VTAPSHPVICGDCLPILQGMSDNYFEATVTSPPYNRVLEWSGGGPNARCHSFDRNKEHWYDDAMPEPEYQEWQKAVVAECLRVTAGPVFYTHKIRYAWKRRGCIYHPLDWLRDFPIWCEIIWDRRGGAGGGSRRYVQSDERVYMLGRPRKWHLGCGYSTVWSIPAVPNKQHPCEFPEELVRRCIEPTTDPGDMVLDPFCGRGTTGIVALKMGRGFLGIDKRTDYCEMTRRNLGDVA